MSIIKKAISIVLCAIMVFSIIPVCNIEAEATTNKTKADAIAWLNANKGKKFGNGQCVYLIYNYSEYLGFPHSGPNACDYTTYSLPSGWKRVKGGTPQKGDIIVYAGGNGYGHVAVYENDTSTWHQNFGDNQCVVNVSYNYKNIKAADGSGYWGYIRPDFEDGGATDSPKVTIDTSSDKYSITNTNAVLCGDIYNPFGAKVSKCGIKLYDENGTLLKDFSNSISYTVSNVEIWFDINDELGYTLTRGTKYKYILYGVVDGKTYSSSTQTFTTKGGYTLSYNANGGSGAPSLQNGLIKYTISSTVPVRNGYSFLGWATNSSATSAAYSAGDSITLTKNTTLYAVWQEIPVYTVYELVYNANGGEYAPKTQTFTEGSSVYISEVEPVRFGYVFEGWVTEDGWWYYPGQEAVFLESTVLYASWGNYKLSLNDSVILEITDDSPELFVEFVPTVSGDYIFESFYTEDTLDTGAILYDENGNALSSSDDWNEDRNFRISYALEEGQTYFICIRSYENVPGTFSFAIAQGFEVVFNANGGYGAPEKLTGDYRYILPFEEPHRDGYVFIGWTTDKSTNSNIKQPGDTIEISGTPITGVTTLYAVWEKTDSPANPNPDGDQILSGFLTIRTPSVTTIKYGDSIVLHADMESVPVAGLKVTWEASNDNFEIVSVSEDGSECVITPRKSGDTSFTATVKIGTATLSTDTQVMTSNAGFFQKIIAFFKKLFGLTKTIPEAFKYVY